MTWVDVVDSTIKIGLGALLGGLFTLYLERGKRKHEYRKDYIKRKWNMLDQIVKELDRFAQDLMNYWAPVRNSLYKRQTSQELTPEDISDLKKYEQELYSAFSDLATIESRLLLIGEKKLSEDFTAYAKHAQEFFKESHYEREDLKAETLDTYKTTLKSMRQELLSKLCKAYEPET